LRRGGDASEEGAAPLEAIFAIVFLLLLSLGVVQVALALYGRNVAISSVHEAARAAIELGRNPDEGAAIAQRTVERAAGGLVDDLRLAVVIEDLGGEEIVRVRLTGRLSAPGPIPVPLPLDVVATAVRPGDVP
jgi:hypothetical protein